MTDLQQWFEIAKYIGAGGAFVLGIGCWQLWMAYRAEIAYSKTRDKETLTVLSAMVNTDKEMLFEGTRREDRILNAIDSLKNIILQHQDKK